METAEPVGSQHLERKYELGISPATVRNEMVKLTSEGYLKQPHTSAGRIPTKEAFKFYVGELLEEKKLSVSDEVAAKEKVWDARNDFDHLMHQTVKALAERTKALAVASIDNDTWHAGYANILEQPEFFDIDVTRTILSFLDEAERIRQLFARDLGEGPIHYLLGDELGFDLLEPCGMVFVNFSAGPKRSGSLGIIGSNRFNYPYVVPTLRYFGNLVEELGKNL